MKGRRWWLCWLVLAAPLGVPLSQASLAFHPVRPKADHYSRLCSAVVRLGNNGSSFSRALLGHPRLFTLGGGGKVELTATGREAFARLQAIEGSRAFAVGYDPELIKLLGLGERKFGPDQRRDVLGQLLMLMAALAGSGGQAHVTKLIQQTRLSHQQLKSLVASTELFRSEKNSASHIIMLTEEGQKFYDQIWERMPAAAVAERRRGNRDLYHAAIETVRALGNGQVHTLHDLLLLVGVKPRESLEQLGLFEQSGKGQLVLSDKGKQAWALVQGLAADQYDPELIKLLGLDRRTFEPGQRRDRLAILLELIAAVGRSGGQAHSAELLRKAQLSQTLLKKSLLTTSDLLQSETSATSAGQIIKLTESGRKFHEQMWGRIPAAMAAERSPRRELYQAAIAAIRLVAEGEVRSWSELVFFIWRAHRRAIEKLGLFDRPGKGQLVLSDKGKQAWALVQGLATDEYDPELIKVLGLTERTVERGQKRDVLGQLLTLMAALGRSGGQAHLTKLIQQTRLSHQQLTSLVTTNELFRSEKDSAHIIKLTEKGQKFYEQIWGRMPDEPPAKGFARKRDVYHAATETIRAIANGQVRSPSNLLRFITADQRAVLEQHGLFEKRGNAPLVLSEKGHKAWALIQGFPADGYDPELIKLLDLHERRFAPGNYRDALGVQLDVIAALWRSGGQAYRKDLVEQKLLNYAQLKSLLETDLVQSETTDPAGHMIKLTESGQKLYERLWGKLK